MTTTNNMPKMTKKAFESFLFAKNLKNTLSVARHYVHDEDYFCYLYYGLNGHIGTWSKKSNCVFPEQFPTKEQAQ